MRYLLFAVLVAFSASAIAERCELSGYDFEVGAALSKGKESLEYYSDNENRWISTHHFTGRAQVIHLSWCIFGDGTSDVFLDVAHERAKSSSAGVPSNNFFLSASQ